MKRLYIVITLLLGLALGSAIAAEVSDDVIYDQVLVRIASDREVGGTNVSVKVTSGVVEITGNVRDEKHKQKVEKVVKKVKGVKAVENRLRIAPV
ncbi:MAG TPA: BON domain-containing protein [Bryobacteraceae bacterium]|nr:BON domain-containing protein [Bryobacteraceae bacterium]